MKNLDHLSPKKVEEITLKLWRISGSLNGVGSLFLYQSRSTCINPDEHAGIGYLLQDLSKEVARLEDMLRCGYDSMATEDKKEE